ncbi:MAG TPA: hypothetical protein VME43_29380, partial [Bryobacteraceae bacterium]|nr:hypothetical protein [Bryobacteraceae bacterium]
MPDSPKSLSEKQLAANRRNAQRSTGPRTAEGKARAALNARKHGFRAEAFTVIRVEDLQAVAELTAAAMACYRPVNTQERHAVERIALAQHSIDRLWRLEAALFTSLLDQAVSLDRDARPGPCSDLIDDGINRFQSQNYFLGEGLRRMDPKLYLAFLRHQGQSERFFRRAVEEFERLRSLRGELPEELPNEPILDTQPQPPERLTPPPSEPENRPGSTQPTPPAAPQPTPTSAGHQKPTPPPAPPLAADPKPPAPPAVAADPPPPAPPATPPLADHPRPAPPAAPQPGHLTLSAGPPQPAPPATPPPAVLQPEQLPLAADHPRTAPKSRPSRVASAPAQPTLAAPGPSVIQRQRPPCSTSPSTTCRPRQPAAIGKSAPSA